MSIVYSILYRVGNKELLYVLRLKELLTLTKINNDDR